MVNAEWLMINRVFNLQSNTYNLILTYDKKLFKNGLAKPY
jgi:hypothetical protein